MLNINHNLINEEESSLTEVINELIREKIDSKWAQETNDWAIEQVTNTTKLYKGSWYKGLLPQEIFLNIILPEHFHNLPDGSYIFPPNTPITKALDYYTKTNQAYTQECMQHIAHLKDQIKNKGFTTSLIIAVVSDQIKHQDGLHRMLALTQLLSDGYEYPKIPAFIFKNNQV